MNEDGGESASYFERLMAAAVKRSIVTPERAGFFTERWHFREKSACDRKFFVLLQLLALAGIVIGLIRVIPKVFDPKRWMVFFEWMGEIWTGIRGWISSWGTGSLAGFTQWVYALLVEAYRFFAQIAAEAYASLSLCFWWLYALVATGARWLVESAWRLGDALFYHIARPEVLSAAIFVLSFLLCWLGMVLERRRPHARRAAFFILYAGCASLFALAVEQALKYGVIAHDWGGLALLGVGTWCLAPLAVVLLCRRNPLFSQCLTFGVMAVQYGGYLYGVSGNAMLGINITLAATVIALAHLARNALPRASLEARYIAMGVIFVFLYAAGFFWDLPGIIDFRSLQHDDSVHISSIFFMALLILAAVATGCAFFLGKTGTRRSHVFFAVLMLATLFEAHLATGVLLGYTSIGEVYDMTGGPLNLSIYTSNTLIAVITAWPVWFGWCLWVLVESRETGQTIMAEIGVIAMLTGLETRYLEVAMNYSFLAGAILLPVMLVPILAASAILRRWLEDLLRPAFVPAPLASREA